jgi:hypothetical protein
MLRNFALGDIIGVTLIDGVRQRVEFGVVLPVSGLVSLRSGMRYLPQNIHMTAYDARLSLRRAHRQKK